MILALFMITAVSCQAFLQQPSPAEESSVAGERIIQPPSPAEEVDSAAAILEEAPIPTPTPIIPSAVIEPAFEAEVDQAAEELSLSFEPLNVLNQGFGQEGLEVAYAFVVENPNPDTSLSDIEFQVTAYDATGAVIATDSEFITDLHSQGDQQFRLNPNICLLQQLVFDIRVRRDFACAQSYLAVKGVPVVNGNNLNEPRSLSSGNHG